MNSMMRNAMIAGALSALFAGSVFAEEESAGTSPAISQERLQLRLNEQAVEAERAKAREQVRSEEQTMTGSQQQTQAQQRLQQRLNEQDGNGEQAKARHEHREQRSEHRMERREMQSRPMKGR